MGYVYRASTFPGETLYTVGFFLPDGNWEPESDHPTREEAADRVAYLNGNQGAPSIAETIERNADAARYVK